MQDCNKEEEIYLMKATLEAVRHEQRKTRASAIAARKQSKVSSKETLKTRRYVLFSIFISVAFELISIWSRT